jgi:hypothetical protein
MDLYLFFSFPWQGSMLSEVDGSGGLLRWRREKGDEEKGR